MHHGFQNTHLRIAKMHMMINKNMIMFWASSLSMGGSISTPRPSTQPKQYHELKQYKKSNYGIELNTSNHCKQSLNNFWRLTFENGLWIHKMFCIHTHTKLFSFFRAHFTLRSPSLLLLVDPICKNTNVRSRCFSCHIMYTHKLTTFFFPKQHCSRLAGK